MKPAIILVSETRSEELLDEFGRYSRDYELPTATSYAESQRRLVDFGRAADVRPASG